MGFRKKRRKSSQGDASQGFIDGTGRLEEALEIDDLLDLGVFLALGDEYMSELLGDA